MSAKEFWDALGTYGTWIWPVQLVFFLVAIVLVAWLFLKPSRLSNALMKLYLVLSFGWVGIIFYMVFYSKSASLVSSYIFGSLFIIVALLLAVDIYRQKLVFCLPKASWQRWGTIIFMLIALCYPLLSFLLGRSFNRIVFPGTLPCPTTAIALVLLTTALPRVDKIIYFILVFFSISPAFNQIPKYGVYEDGIMLGIGIYSLVMLVTHWRDKPELCN